MRFLTLLVFSCVLASCFSRSTYMTRNTYDDIMIGTPIADVKKQSGEPYAVHSKGSGVQEYEYIERVQLAQGRVVENHYFFIVTGGEVVGKYSQQTRPPAYDLIYQEDPNNLTY